MVLVVRLRNIKTFKETLMIWFTADTHFGHTAILRHQKARKHAFQDIETMDTAFIDSLNKFIKRNDTLYHLGDFCWQASRAGHYRQRINCRKVHVAQGNHDSSSLKAHVSSMNHMIFLKNPKIHMQHYPCVSWPALHYGGVHLYGHCHGTMEDQLNEVWPGRRALDVGFDSIHKLTGAWRPISLDEVFALVV